MIYLKCIIYLYFYFLGWCIGFTIFLIGQIVNLLAMGYASQSVAATLGSFSLVTNGQQNRKQK
jgi:hypothetical protein